MTPARAEEIIRLTFYKYIDKTAGMIARKCDNSEVAFEVGRYMGLMQKELENELAKEVKGG